MGHFPKKKGFHCQKKVLKGFHCQKKVLKGFLTIKKVSVDSLHVLQVTGKKCTGDAHYLALGL